MNFPFKAILFDWAYTLVDLIEDNDRDPLKAVFEFLDGRGVQLPEFDGAYAACHDIFYKMIAVSRESHLEARFEQVLSWFLMRYQVPIVGRATIPEILTVYYDEVYRHRKVYGDVMETLDTFKAAQIPMGIVSNTTNPGVMKDREQALLGLDAYFEFSIYSSEAPFRKPHPSIFQLAVDRLGLPVDQVLFVGDSLYADVVGAQGIGLRAVWVNRNRHQLPQGVVPDYEIRNISELLQLPSQ